MTPTQRAAALAAYRDRKPPAGVYALHCAGTGQVWVGSSPDLDKIANRHWFTLGQGTHPNASLQAAFDAQGRAGFQFDILEILPDDTMALSRARLLEKARDKHIADLSALRL